MYKRQDYTSPEPEKSFGLLDEESSCYIELPAEWEGNLMLTDSAEGEEAVELHTVDEGKLVLTMRLVPSSESAAGWTLSLIHISTFIRRRRMFTSTIFTSPK